LFASCEKDEKALVLPPTGTAQHSMVEMGVDYDDQIYFDLGTGKSIFSSANASWHLAIQSGPNGRHIYMNGGNSVFTYNTHKTSMDEVTEVPSGLYPNGTGWSFDAPSGNPDSTGIGEWFDGTGATKGEVYILQIDSQRYVKMRILYSDAQVCRLEWSPLENIGSAPIQVDVPKDANYDFAYFSFDKGVTHPDPPKETWDIVFIRYRYVFHTPAYPNFPYTVCGVLLNPSNTMAAADSTGTYEQMDIQKASALKMYSTRDVIGWDWKSYSFQTGRYTVNRNKVYIIQTRNNQLFKFHFLDFYNANNAKGSPSFEFERLK
jgi:hypothetical protein